MTPTQHHGTRPLREASTAELITELLTRYDEALFVGCKPHGTITSNGSPITALPPKPVVDVNSKLDKTTGMGGTLATILSNVLMGLRARGQVRPTATCGN